MNATRSEATTARPGTQPSDAELRALFVHMLRVRCIDQRMLKLQRAGRIGFVGTALGQEAAMIGSAAALEPRDWLWSGLREGGAAVMRGLPLAEYVAQMFCNANDTAKGRQMCNHFQHKGLLELAAELGDLAERTRSGKAKPDELKGSTFSITNAGNIGGTLATPIINFPEVAILGVHRIVKRPGVVETPQGDKIEVRQYMNLSISVDHRIVDGASAARFLVHMKRLLENPGLLAL